MTTTHRALASSSVYRRGVLLLRLTAIAGVAIGLFFLLGRAWAAEVFQRLYFGDRPVAGEDHLVLAYGVLGAVMVGWLLLVLFAVRRLEAGDRRSWSELAWSFGSWAVLDTTHSVVAGSVGNVVLNLVFVAGMVGGLWWSRPTQPRVA